MKTTFQHPISFSSNSKPQLRNSKKRRRNNYLIHLLKNSVLVSIILLSQVVISNAQSQCTYFTLHGPQSECDGLNNKVYSAYSSNGASINAVWTPINGVINSQGTISNSEAFVDITWIQGQPHSLLCYDSNSGCTDTLYVQACCNPSATIRDLSSKKNLLDIQIALGAPQIQGQLDVTGPRTIYVEGEFELRDIDVTFDQCDFIMAPGSVIYLPGPDNNGSNYAAFSHCTFKAGGCEKMWQGLFCPMEADLTLDHCTIQDAEFGVKIYGKMTLYAYSTIFSRNYIGIFVPPTLASTDFGLGSEINNCLFDGAPTLYPTYYGQFPTPQGNQSHIGILVCNLVGTFPSVTNSSSAQTNQIKNLPLGIVGLNSTIDGIYNFNFQNIQYSTNYPGKSGGIAILARSPNTNTRLVVGNQNTISDIRENTFTNCRYGIVTNNKCKPTIKYNHFFHTQSNFQNIMSISVNNCNIATPSTLGQIEIQHNTFTESNYYLSAVPPVFLSTAIYIGNGIQTNEDVDISWNIMNNMRIGVYLINLRGETTDPDALSIHDNQINSTIPHTQLALLNYQHYGIWANAVNWASIGSNDIYRSVSLTNAPANFETMMLAFNLKQIQNCRVNYNNITNYGTSFRALGNCNASLFQCNQLFTCVQGFRMANVSMTPQGSASQPSDNKWIGFPTPSATTYNRANGTSISIIDWYHIDDVNTTIISNDYSPSPTPNILLWDHPFITGQSCYPSSLLNSEVINHIHQIANNNIVYADHPIENAIMDKEFAFKVISADANLRSQYPDLKEFYDTYKLMNEGDFYNAGEQIQDGNLDDALASLNLIVNPETIEQYKITTSRLAIDQLKYPEKEFGETDLNDLESIAWTDAWLGGTSVFNARHLLMEEVDDLEQNLRIRNPKAIPSISTNFSAYPNPANDKLSIFTDLGFENDNSIELVDLSGRIILKQNVQDNTLNTQEIPNGFYILKLLKNNEVRSVIKIQINH